MCHFLTQIQQFWSYHIVLFSHQKLKKSLLGHIACNQKKKKYVRDSNGHLSFSCIFNMKNHSFFMIKLVSLMITNNLIKNRSLIAPVSDISKPALRSYVSDPVGVSFSTNEIESSTILKV